MANKNELALVQASDLSLVENNALNASQLKQLLKKTPPQYVHTRPAKGGGQWEYVTGGYVRKVLNLMFGWDWSFEIINKEVIHGEAIVMGKLTCNCNGRSIVKMQFGNKDVAYRRETDKEGNKIPLSIGNDYKAAATDALKKCAAELGIAADIYNKMDFKEVQVDTSEAVTLEDLQTLYDMKKEALGLGDRVNAERILNTQERASYQKLHRQLSTL